MTEWQPLFVIAQPFLLCMVSIGIKNDALMIFKQIGDVVSLARLYREYLVVWFGDRERYIGLISFCSKLITIEWSVGS